MALSELGGLKCATNSARHSHDSRGDWSVGRAHQALVALHGWAITCGDSVSRYGLSGRWLLRW
jgi:hypothetical protein